LSVLSVYWDCNKVTAKHIKLTWQACVYKQESLNKQKDAMGLQVPLAFLLQSTRSFRATLHIHIPLYTHIILLISLSVSVIYLETN
jgi:hypothetical protein